MLTPLVVAGGCVQSQLRGPATVFQYRFYEQTGQNQFVVVDGEEVPIRFDRISSSSAALSALDALTWNVIYPNADGEISLLGWRAPEDGRFVLEHWTLAVPFDCYELPTWETPLSAPELLQSRMELEPADFEPPQDVDVRQFLRLLE